MKKKHKELLSVIIILLVLFGVLAIVVANTWSKQPTDNFIFKDIDECQNLLSLSYEDGKTTVYNSPSDDNYLKDLTYVDFFAAKYESAELEFEIFAYVFNTSETAQKYFKNVTGKSVDLATNFSSSYGIGLFGVSSAELVVIDSERAYIIHIPHNQLEKLEKLLGEIFTVKI